MADVARYECETKSLHFRQTCLYQARTATFTVSNPADMSLPFELKLVDFEMADGALACVRVGGFVGWARCVGDSVSADRFSYPERHGQIKTQTSRAVI